MGHSLPVPQAPFRWSYHRRRQSDLAQIVIVGLSLAMMLALTLMLRATPGQIIRAVAQNRHAAALLGVDGTDRRVNFIASALGGGGRLSAVAFNVLTPDMGRSIELKGLAVILGMGASRAPYWAGSCWPDRSVQRGAHRPIEHARRTAFSLLF
jgi:branched-subunit amino acid ABC-type transport system permease component